MNQALSFTGRTRRFLATAATAAALSSLVVATLPTTAGALINRNWMATYAYSSVNYYVNGDTTNTAHPQTQFLTMDPCTTTFAGPGTEAYGNSRVIVTSLNYDSTGSATSGTYTVEYLVNGPWSMTNYEIWVTFDLIKQSDGSYDGSYSGTWSDNLGNNPLTYETGTVTASAPTTTWYGVHGQYVAAMGGGKSAAQSCVGMPLPGHSQL